VQTNPKKAAAPRGVSEQFGVNRIV